MAGTQFGIPPKNIANLDYTGADLALEPVVEADRAPTVNDKNYPIDCFWRNRVTRDLWWLSGFDSTGALWIRMTGGATGPAIMFPVPNGTSPVVADLLGNVSLTSTLGSVTITGGLNTINFDLAGGGLAIDQINVDAHTAPGTDPVLPTITGEITVTGAQVAAGVVGTNVIRTDSLAANTYTIEIQRSQAVGVTTIADNGVSHFDSAAFTVDANGFVSLIGGAAAIEKLNGDDGISVAPTAGLIHLFGATVPFGTHVKPVFFQEKTATTDTVELDVQLATTSTFAGRTINDAGLASFDSSQFTIDAATGFVQSKLSGAVFWQTIIASQALTKDNGYMCISPGGALVLTLPVTPAIGDTIKVTLDGATSFQVVAGAGDIIRIGNAVTSAGGSLTSTLPGDTLELVAQSAARWNIISFNGNFTIT